MTISSSTTISGQPGRQTEFLKNRAVSRCMAAQRVAGRRVGLIPEPLRHVGRVPNFAAVFFRRTMPQITAPSGLWDESVKFYPHLGGILLRGTHEWRWLRGGKINFAYLQFETTVYDCKARKLP